MMPDVNLRGVPGTENLQGAFSQGLAHQGQMEVL